MKKIFVGLLILASLFGIAPLSYADYVIYDDSWKFYPDGYMGQYNGEETNGRSLTFEASCTDTPWQGAKCTKITYDKNSEDWAGIICYSSGEGINLNNFKKFSFKARAAEDNTKVSFWMGSGDDSCGEHKIPQPSILSTGWQEFTLDLTEEDMSNVKTLLGFVISNNETISNPVTFYIDDVRYTGLNIIDLVALTGFHKGEIDLTWTAPTGEGAVIEYLVRYSESPIETEEDFGNATVYVQEPIWSPEIPGTKEKHTLNLNPGTVYYIAVKAEDNLGNQGELSNTVGNCAMARAQVIGISIEGAYDFGEVSVGEGIISTECFLVKNIGDEVLTCLLNLKNPPGWTAVQSEPTGHNNYILNVMFNSTAPASFSNSQHALSITPVECGTSPTGKFAGNEDGVALSPGEETDLWVEFKAPQTTSVGAPQAISICVSAQSYE